MHFIKSFRIFLIILIGLNLGCTQKKLLPPQPETPVQKKFELKCLKDYGSKFIVYTRLAGKTFWIYAPTDKPLFDFSAGTPAPPDNKLAKYNLLYVDGSFKDRTFYFEYDVVNPKIESDSQSEGISNEVTNDFKKIYDNLSSAITETLLDPKTPVSFVVMAITDIKKGMEARYTFYLEDYRKFTKGTITFDEFEKRLLQESKGNRNFIGDKTGQHLEYNDIKMPDFLTKQIINRIRIKFNQGDFSPQENYEEAIIGIIADVLRIYHFTDFKEVRTDDLRASPEKKMIFTPKLLDSFGEDKQKDSAQQSK